MKLSETGQDELRRRGSGGNMRTVNDPRFRAILENVTYGIVTIDDPSSVPPSAVVLRPVLPPSAVMLRRTGRSPASPPVLRSATEDGKAMPEAVATDDGRTGARAVANLASPAIARFTKAGEALARPPSGVVRRTGRRLRRVEAGTVVSFNHVAEGLFQPRGRRPFGYLAGAVVGHSVNMVTAEPSASMAAVLPVMCAWAKS